MTRILKVVRMQMINKAVFIWTPLITLGIAFVCSLLIFGILRPTEMAMSLAAQAPLWYFLVLGVQSLTLTFPFSQAMSVSRHTFFLGTVLTAIAASAAMATLYIVLRPLETATNGWGVWMGMFGIPWVTDGPWYHGWVFFLGMMLVFFLLGFWVATVYKRWGIVASTAVLLLLGLLAVVFVAITTWNEWWVRLGTWFVQQTSLSIGGILLGAAVLLAGSSYLTLRRAIP